MNGISAAVVLCYRIAVFPFAEINDNENELDAKRTDCKKCVQAKRIACKLPKPSYDFWGQYLPREPVIHVPFNIIINLAFGEPGDARSAGLASWRVVHVSAGDKRNGIAHSPKALSEVGILHVCGRELLVKSPENLEKFSMYHKVAGPKIASGQINRRVIEGRLKALAARRLPFVDLGAWFNGGCKGGEPVCRRDAVVVSENQPFAFSQTGARIPI